MRNLAAKLGKIFDICKKFSKNLVDERGNIPRRGVVLAFLTLKLSHLVSQQSNLVWIVNRICLLYSKSTNPSSQTSFLISLSSNDFSSSPVQ